MTRGLRSDIYQIVIRRIRSETLPAEPVRLSPHKRLHVADSKAHRVDFPTPPHPDTPISSLDHMAGGEILELSRFVGFGSPSEYGT